MNFYNTLLVISMVDCGELVKGLGLRKLDSEYFGEFLHHSLNNCDCEFLQHTHSYCDGELR